MDSIGAFLYTLLLCGVLIAGTILTTIGDVFHDIPEEKDSTGKVIKPAQKDKFWLGGLAMEVIGIIFIIFSALFLVLRTTNLAELQRLQHRFADIPSGSVDTLPPANFTIVGSKANWTIDNPDKVIWIALTFTDKNDKDTTIVFRPWEHRTAGTNDWEFDNSILDGTKKATLWYSTQQGPSKNAEFIK